LKRGFSLFYMLAIIIILNSLLLMGLKYAKFSKRVSVNDIFLQKARLFLQNSIELSLLAISGYDRSKKLNCLQKIKIISKDKNFIADIKIKRYFISKNFKNFCQNAKMIESDESNAMVLMQITVTNNPKSKKIKENIKLVKQTLQKI